MYFTSRYLYVPPHGSPYCLWSAWTLHISFPLHCALIFESDVFDLQDVVCTGPSGQICLPSDRPYIADFILILMDIYNVGRHTLLRKQWRLWCLKVNNVNMLHIWFKIQNSMFSINNILQIIPGFDFFFISVETN